MHTVSSSYLSYSQFAIRIDDTERNLAERSLLLQKIIQIVELNLGFSSASPSSDVCQGIRQKRGLGGRSTYIKYIG